VKASKLTKAERREVEDLQSMLRAFGLIDAETDLVEALDTVSDAGVVAFYDTQAEEVVVRGKGALDVDRRATLAHELTHVLQDQHFDLEELRRAATDSKTSSPGALTAIIEGDAERIQDAYLRKLSRAEQAEYDAAQAEGREAYVAEIESAPELVKVALSAPYIFGPPVVEIIAAKGGNRAVDAAIRRGAPTDRIYLDPAAALQREKVTKVPTPPVPQHARRVGEADEIGPFDLFTLLASRVDRQVALSAADAWQGDRVVAYRTKGRVCARATIATTAEGEDAMTGALTQWAAAMPDAAVTAGPRPHRVTVTSCEAPETAAPGSGTIEGALRLLAVRNGILASAVDSDVPTAIGRCVAHRIVQEPLFASLIDQDTEPSADVQRQVGELMFTLASDCRVEEG
jgi:hypothetical protein